jgi:hypothetical protein
MRRSPSVQPSFVSRLRARALAVALMVAVGAATLTAAPAQESGPCATGPAIAQPAPGVGIIGLSCTVTVTCPTQDCDITAFGQVRGYGIVGMSMNGATCGPYPLICSVSVTTVDATSPFTVTCSTFGPVPNVAVNAALYCSATVV